MRKHSEYTRRLCRLYKVSKAASSPCFARSIASASVAFACFGSVKSPFPAAYYVRCGFKLFSLYALQTQLPAATATQDVLRIPKNYCFLSVMDIYGHFLHLGLRC